MIRHVFFFGCELGGTGRQRYAFFVVSATVHQFWFNFLVSTFLRSLPLACVRTSSNFFCQPRVWANFITMVTKLQSSFLLPDLCYFVFHKFWCMPFVRELPCLQVLRPIGYALLVTINFFWTGWIDSFSFTHLNIITMSCLMISLFRK